MTVPEWLGPTPLSDLPDGWRMGFDDKERRPFFWSDADPDASVTWQDPRFPPRFSEGCNDSDYESEREEEYVDEEDVGNAYLQHRFGNAPRREKVQPSSSRDVLQDFLDTSSPVVFEHKHMTKDRSTNQDKDADGRRRVSSRSRSPVPRRKDYGFWDKARFEALKFNCKQVDLSQMLRTLQLHQTHNDLLKTQVDPGRVPVHILAGALAEVTSLPSEEREKAFEKLRRISNHRCDPGWEWR